MAAVKKRKAGVKTCPLTVRLSLETHERLKRYASHTRQSMALTLDKLILKGTPEMVVRTEESAVDRLTGRN